MELRYLQLSILGRRESRGGAQQAPFDENTVMFRHGERESG
ncbi:MAG: hypothetical protein ABI862_08045 [Ilumatobacteraceae bacterium]